MKLDATAPTSTAFFFDNRWFEGDEVETVHVAAGTHSFSILHAPR